MLVLKILFSFRFLSWDSHSRETKSNILFFFYYQNINTKKKYKYIYIPKELWKKYYLKKVRNWDITLAKYYCHKKKVRMKTNIKWNVFL